MSRYKIKGLPPIKLVDLLRKRRITLQKFVKEFGIVTYQTLVQKCEKMGVSAPDEKDFKEACGGTFSSPQEGLIVLDPPELIKESGEKIKVDSFIDHDLVEFANEAEAAPVISVSGAKSFKKSRKNLAVEVVDVSLPADVELK